MPKEIFYGYRIHGKENDVFHIHVERDSLVALRRFNDRLKKAELKTGELKLLKFEIDYHFKKRTLDQNALSWVLYTIEAYAHNSGLSGAKAQEVTPNHLYENDVSQYCPVAVIKMKREHVEFIKQEYRKCDIVKEEGDTIYLRITVTQSHFNTVQMAQWIDRQMNRMAYFGIPTEKQAELHRAWKDWRQMLNDEKIVLHDDVITIAEYKEAVPICEATGTWLGSGGSVAHIDARGIGGNPEDWKNTAANYLHLTDEAHNLFDNGKGRDLFLERYPHLRHKVERSLKKEIVKPEKAPLELDIF